MLVPSVTAAGNSSGCGVGAMGVQLAPSNRYEFATIAPLLTPAKLYMLDPSVTVAWSMMGIGITVEAVQLQGCAFALPAANRQNKMRSLKGSFNKSPLLLSVNFGCIICYLMIEMNPPEEGFRNFRVER
jgi:hypothetical protein